jgi:ABC-2 type transport system ATP-binding protein
MVATILVRMEGFSRVMGGDCTTDLREQGVNWRPAPPALQCAVLQRALGTMIHAEDLTKSYGPTRAIDRLSFDIERGQIVGFLGPNGAGKTTTMRILTGFMPPTAGRATVNGHDVLHASDQARAAIGYMPEGTPLYDEMRAQEYLDYRGRLLGLDRRRRKQRIDACVDRCGLAPVRRRRIGSLSKGNRQRVGLAQALLSEPPVLILDEPTAGLDPVQIGAVRELIGELRGSHTVLLSSHILPEVEKTADRVMVIAGGRLVADGTVEALRRRVGTGARLLVEAQAQAPQLEAALKAVPGVAAVTLEPVDGWQRATVQAKEATDLREPIARALQGRNILVREIRPAAASLEDFFVQITETPKPVV